MEFRSRMTSDSGSGNMAWAKEDSQLRRRLLPPLRSSQTWLRSVLLDYYVIVCVKMCDDGSPCCSCVAVSTLSVPEVPCSQVDVLDGI